MNDGYTKVSVMSFRAVCTMITCVSGVFMCIPRTASAASDSFELYDKRTKQIIVCKKIQNSWEPGSFSEKSGKYTSFKALIKQINTRILRNSPKKKTLESQVKKLSKNLAPQQRLCRNAAPNTPKPTPTASGTQTPKPTATPQSGCSQSCYNSSRVTQCFQIPSSVPGSETRGGTLWSGCMGCHTESTHRNRTYTQISAAFSSIPQMLPFASNYRSQDIADITAYLNRYNSKQCRSDWP
jgi:hypothetical protein